MARTSIAERAEYDSRRVSKVYDRLSRFYDDWFDWALGPGRRRAVQGLTIEPGERVLEIGVGTGLSLPHYPNPCHVTGIDISRGMLEQARERATGLGLDADLRVMDAQALAFPDDSFDHVVAPYVVSVVPQPRVVMAEMGRVCRPGGTVMVVNHFGSPRRMVRPLERLATPISQWLGFKLDVPIETVTQAAGLELMRIERVNLFGWWRLIELRRRETSDQAAAC